MGTGASNQVRSKCSLEERKESFTCKEETQNETRSSRMSKLPPSTYTVVNNQSQTSVSQNNEVIKDKKISQKSETNSLPSPSPHVRKNSQEKTEVIFRNVSKHDLEQKIKELELSLEKCERHKSHLQDQVQTIEKRCNALTEIHSSESTNIVETLQEMLRSKDHQIAKLEEDLKNVQIEFQKKGLKYKKRIRGLAKQIFELRQEILIIQMEVKARQNDLAENSEVIIPESSKNNGILHLKDISDNSHNKIIVELSTQISEQGEQIDRLTSEVTEKTQRIKILETTLNEIRKSESTVPVVDPSGHSEILNSNNIATTNRKKRKGKLENSSSNTVQMSAFIHTRNEISAHARSKNNSHTGASHKPALDYHITALSDSDSDWSDGHCLPNVQRHSAPAQSRMKRSLSKPVTAGTKTKDMSFESNAS